MIPSEVKIEKEIGIILREQATAMYVYQMQLLALNTCIKFNLSKVQRLEMEI